MSEHAPQAEVLPSSEAMFAAVDGMMATEPNPLQRAYLYAAGMQAGDVRHTTDGKLFGSLSNTYFKYPAFGPSSTALDVLDMSAKGMGELHGRGYGMDEPASQLAAYAAQVCGVRSKGHNKVAIQLVEAGIAGGSDELLEHYTADTYQATAATGTRRTYHAEKYLSALVTGLGVDVLADGSPYRELSELIWKDEGADPRYFGHTYYLAQAYAEQGNAVRAYELLHELQDPDKHVKPLLSLAEHTADEGIRAVAESEVVNLVRGASRRMIHAPQFVAEYFARTGNVEAAEHWLQIGTYPESMQARTWANIYLHTGDEDARLRAMNLWFNGFTPNVIDARLLTDVAIKDTEVGWFDEGTSVPLAAWQLIHANRGPLAEYSAQPLALMAEEFADDGNGEALAVLVKAICSPWSGKRDMVRGLSAAAVGLTALEAGLPATTEDFPAAAPDLPSA